MWDYLSVFISLQVTWRIKNCLIFRNKMDLILAPYFHASDRGTWHHLSGRRLGFLNGSILAIHLKSYYDQDLKSNLKFEMLTHDLTDEILRCSLFM